MSADPVRAIADAVLYEGYLLWPYRKSALKNQQRFTFGGVHPPRWEDRSAIQAQVLLEGDEDAHVEVRVRFLHMLRRQVLRAGSSSGSLESVEGFEADRLPPDLEPVEELEVDEERWVTWDEAVEREIEPGPLRVAAGEQWEEISGGAIRRSWFALEGDVTVAREVLRPGLLRLTVRVANTTSWSGRDRQEALRRTFCSTH